MTDNKKNIYLRNLGVSYDEISQFSEFNCEEELTEIQARMYYLMIHGSFLRGEKEKLYGWCSRIGLSNSTTFGIFKKNNKTMHSSVAEKIAGVTGAYPAWVQHGIGIPFPSSSFQQSVEVANSQQIKTAFEDKHPMELLEVIPLESHEINKELLEQCFDLTDGVLEATFSSMRADDKSDYIVKLYETRLDEVNQEFKLDKENFMLAIFTIEVALFYTRHTMTPKSKAQLIPDIYEKYHSNPAMKQATIKQLEKYRGENF